MIMTVKDLKAILSLLPDDTSICATDGGSGCSNLESARYCPQWSILYLEPWWTGENKSSTINMNPSGLSPAGVNTSQTALFEINRLAKESKRLIDEMKDGKNHRVQIYVSEGKDKRYQGFVHDGTGFFAIIDGNSRVGRDTGGTTNSVCEFKWKSLKD